MALLCAQTRYHSQAQHYGQSHKWANTVLHFETPQAYIKSDHDTSNEVVDSQTRLSVVPQCRQWYAQSSCGHTWRAKYSFCTLSVANAVKPTMIAILATWTAPLSTCSKTHMVTANTQRVIRTATCHAAELVSGPRLLQSGCSSMQTACVDTHTGCSPAQTSPCAACMQ